jgi:hypothetical protein
MFEKEQQIISGSNCLCKGYMRSEIKEPHSKVEAIVYVNVTWDLWNEGTTSNCLCINVTWYNHKCKQLFM